MKLLFAVVLAFTALACDKTIQECRTLDPQPALAAAPQVAALPN
jgi:hypothetical protein